MGATARRAIKGYTYQQSVFALFLTIIDTERSIAKITVEALNTKNFADIYLECVSDGEVPRKTYRIQAKNYPDTTIEDISIAGTETLIPDGIKKHPVQNGIEKAELHRCCIDFQLLEIGTYHGG